VLVDEQPSSILGQETPQHPPELFEPAHRHMGKPGREEDHIKPVVRRPRKHVGNLERDVSRPHPITSDSHRLGRRIDRHDSVGHAHERLCPYAGSAGDLQHSSARMHLRNQPRDALASRRNIPIRRHVVLARTATVVTNLIGQNLVGHIHIITRRRRHTQPSPAEPRGPAPPVTTGPLWVDMARACELGTTGLIAACE
jgi:hypothetical protein